MATYISGEGRQFWAHCCSIEDGDNDGKQHLTVKYKPISFGDRDQ